jgi:ribosomal protein L37E
LDCIDDAYEAQVNLKHVCRSCGSLSLHLEDGWCSKCNSDEPTIGDEIRREMARARENTRRAEERANKRAGY